MRSQFDSPQSLAEMRRFVDIEDYLDHVCHPLVKRMSYAEREVIRAEIRSHIAGLVQAHRELGSSTEEAIAAALLQFGDPKTIGRSLLKEHSAINGSPSMALWIMMLTVTSSSAGLGALAGIVNSRAQRALSAFAPRPEQYSHRSGS
jgi:hypothetical protein